MSSAPTPTPAPASRIPKVDWPTAFVIVAALATVVGLVALKQSLPAIAGFIGSGAGAYLAFRSAIQGRTVDEVKSLANGNNEALRQQVSDTRAEMLALSKDHARVVAALAAKWPANVPLPPQVTEPARGNAGNTGP